MKIIKSASKNIWNLIRFEMVSDFGYGIGFGVSIHEFVAGFFYEKCTGTSSGRFGVSILPLKIYLISPLESGLKYKSPEKCRFEILRKDNRLGFEFAFQPNHFTVGLHFDKSECTIMDDDLYWKFKESNPSLNPTSTRIGIALFPIKASFRWPSTVRDQFCDAKINEISTA